MYSRREEVAPRRDSKYFNSDDYIRATWNDQHGDENTYVPGREIVFAALLGPAPGEIKCQGTRGGGEATAEMTPSL